MTIEMEKETVHFATFALCMLCTKEFISVKRKVKTVDEKCCLIIILHKL